MSSIMRIYFYLPNYLFMYLFIYLFLCLSIYLFIYLFIGNNNAITYNDHIIHLLIRWYVMQHSTTYFMTREYDACAYRYFREHIIVCKWDWDCRITGNIQISTRRSHCKRYQQLLRVPCMAFIYSQNNNDSTSSDVSCQSNNGWALQALFS